METEAFRGELERQALADLIKRGKSGSFIYAIIWFVIAAVNELHYAQPVLVTFNLALFVLVGSVRASLGYLPESFLRKYYKSIGRVLEVCVCFQSLHFGILATYVYHVPALQELVFPMMLAAAGIGGAGTATLAINKNIRLAYPALLLAPFFISFLFFPSDTNFILACICIIFLVYIYAATEHVYGDYWSASINSALLSEKAVELRELSITDPLTTLHNRAFFNSHLETEWRRAARSRMPVSVLFVDLDYFKLINDKYGHLIGDLCLQRAATLLKKYGQRAGDAVARYGGEEFVIFFSDTESAGAAKIAERIVSEFRSIAVETADASIDLRCSIGVCTCVPDVTKKQSEFLREADEAMYQAKQRGRDCYVVYERDYDIRSSSAGSSLQELCNNLVVLNPVPGG